MRAAICRSDSTLNGITALEGGFTQLAKEPLRFQFNVFYPLMIAIRRILAGAGIGAGLLGLPRLLLFLCNGTKTASFNDPWASSFVWPFFVAFLVLLVCIYTALRIWLKALRGSER